MTALRCQGWPLLTDLHPQFRLFWWRFLHLVVYRPLAKREVG